MTLVVDASLIVAALIDTGPVGAWATTLVAAEPLVAPHLMPVEVTNILRRSEAAGDITPDSATLALEDLLALPVDLVPYLPFAARVWQVRGNLTAYDAWYVAVAEGLNVALATLDARLARAPGLRCEVLLPR